MRFRRWRTTVLGVATAVVAATILTVTTVGHSSTAAALHEGRIKQASMYSQTLGSRIDYEVYLPYGYASGAAHYPTIYLLHGRGDSMEAWTREKSDLDQMIADGDIPPVIAIMPDAPWSERASWYVNSAYTGTDMPGAGVEAALTKDLVKFVDSHYRTVAGRWGRAVGGYSMGGYGALRYVLAHQRLFGAALVLSPAVFTPLPPADDDIRDYGAFGVGETKFVDRRYQRLNYPALLGKVDPDLPVHLFLAVGDKEYVYPDPADAHHDLDFETAVAYNQLIRTPGVTADWRVLGGGHDWDVWTPGFVEGMENLAGYLSTTKPVTIDTPLLGTAGDDWAGGVVPRDDGSVTTALAAAGSINGQAAHGGLDAVVTRTAADGSLAWTTELGTAGDDRLYGAVDAGGGNTVVAGYTNGNLDGSHPGTSGDAFAARVGADGTVGWTTQLGDPAAADRAYAVTSDGSGGVYLAGYTKGSVGGVTNAGDKDALLAHLDSTGRVVWTAEFGGPGEDKSYGVAAAGGKVYVVGTTSGAMPGAQALGGEDGWVAAFDADGNRDWVHQIGSSEDDLLQGVTVRPDGTIVVAGSTGGDAAGASSGGVDVLDAGYSPDGTQVWENQFGTGKDDVAVDANTVGTAVELVGFTDGKLTAQVGGSDAFVAGITDTGALAAATQFGTAADDGVDAFGESNLFAAASGGREWVTGNTYGASGSHGGSDVFTYAVAAPR